jgi:hypothetical protein
MNLQAARTELKGRSPRIAPRVLAVEAVVVVSVSIILVSIFT